MISNWLLSFHESISHGIIRGISSSMNHRSFSITEMEAEEEMYEKIRDHGAIKLRTADEEDDTPDMEPHEKSFSYDATSFVPISLLTKLPSVEEFTKYFHTQIVDHDFPVSYPFHFRQDLKNIKMILELEKIQAETLRVGFEDGAIRILVVPADAPFYIDKILDEEIIMEKRVKIPPGADVAKTKVVLKKAGSTSYDSANDALKITIPMYSSHPKPVFSFPIVIE
ncbi:hypothetical protein ADUPG1_008899 [Aduncisulcus paluster]|uniref:Uncharacterized protein n=1 Tax=Aduncisulcus paluster TaxID=2918883 RepID=A0ABQ5KTN2_9EUKA|nr:hypothetical protein ADUPG1_008899 [Aduncisulcus paluster]